MEHNRHGGLKSPKSCRYPPQPLLEPSPYQPLQPLPVRSFVSSGVPAPTIYHRFDIPGVKKGYLPGSGSQDFEELVGAMYDETRMRRLGGCGLLVLLPLESGEKWNLM